VYEFGIGTIMGVATKLGVHRRMVREAIGSALPKPRKKPERPRWKLKEAIENFLTLRSSFVTLPQRGSRITPVVAPARF